MNSIKHLSKNTLWYLLGHIIFSLVGMLPVMLLIWNVSLDEFGLITYAYSILAMIYLISGFGISEGVFRNFHEPKYRDKYKGRL